MRLVFKVRDNLGEAEHWRWQKQFVATGRTVFQSIWRRTQDAGNAGKSGWRSPADQRRRILHHYDQYAMVPSNGGYSLALAAPYMWLSIASPVDEIDQYREVVRHAASRGGWQEAPGSGGAEVLLRGDLALLLRAVDQYTEDARVGRSFPSSYRMLDLTLTSTATDLPKGLTTQPWTVFNTGIRRILAAGRPTVIKNLAGLRNYFPMHVELGCGPSIEAGIPPLHYLHEIYSVSDPRTGAFVLSPAQDKLLPQLLEDPEAFFCRASLPYAQAITVQPTPFFFLLKDLADSGYVVGPIITNNFDGLCSAVDLSEHYVRRYEESEIIPGINFREDAKALAVFGAHADRRRVHEAARKKCLAVVHIDPEGFYEDGAFHSYPLESPQDGDILIRMTARDFTDGFREFFPRLHSVP